jgi:prepilin-type N-terminal cleavage/methylation domain-containing protein
MKTKSGFTLIEIILVIMVIGLALPVLFNIVFTVLRQQVKIIALQEIKRQGDSAVNSIETAVKNQAVAIFSDDKLLPSDQQCLLSGSSYAPEKGIKFYLKDKNGNWFRYRFVDPYIASDESSLTNPNGIPLTNPKVIISNFSITCKKSANYSFPVVSVSFKVSHKEGSSLNYNTRIKLRNY